MLADRSLAITGASGQRSAYRSRFLLVRARIAFAASWLEEARPQAGEALALEQAAAGAGAVSAEIGRSALLLGRAMEALGRDAEARVVLATALRHREATLGTEHPDAQLARRLVG